MSQKGINISYKLRGMFENAWPLLSGIVKSVDEDAATAIIVTTLDEDDDPNEEVLLNVVINNMGGMLMIPKIGADCILMGIDGDALFEILKASEYDKVVLTVADRKLEIKDGQWTFDEGNNAGIPVVGKIEDNLRTLKDYIKNTLEPAIATAITGAISTYSANPAASTVFTTTTSTQQIILSDMENKKLKH